MSKEELDRAMMEIIIGDDPVTYNEVGEKRREKLLNLLNEVINSLIPTPKSKLDDAPEYPPEDDEEYMASNNDFKTASWLSRKQGYNQAIDEITQAKEELLG